eukprot:scaffold13520_cov158-Skeletonema_marinoi.AAC.3
MKEFDYIALFVDGVTSDNTPNYFCERATVHQEEENIIETKNNKWKRQLLSICRERDEDQKMMCKIQYDNDDLFEG